MKVYLLVASDYDDSYVVKGFYLKEEAKDIVDLIAKFTYCHDTKWAKNTDAKNCCSVEAIDYECRKILPEYESNYTYYVDEVEIS